MRLMKGWMRMKKNAMIALLMSVLLLALAGCSSNPALKYATQALKACDDMKAKSGGYYTVINSAYYMKYSDKGELAPFPDGKVWETVPDAGYCLLFDVPAEKRIDIIAYVDLNGEVVYTGSDLKYQKAQEEVDWYNSPSAIEDAKKKNMLDSHQSLMKRALGKVLEYGDAAQFLYEQMANCNAGTNKGFKAFSEKEIKAMQASLSAEKAE